MALLNRPIVVDDSDSQIRYRGSGWDLDFTGSQDGFGTYGATYNYTLHATQFNDSLTFSFHGSSIKVFGTVNLSPTYGGVGVVEDSAFRPPWECFVDNISIGNSKPSPYHENNWILCENDHLKDGPHELTLNISMRQGTTFWIDYLQYTPSGDATDNAVVLVENTDPALSYDSSWRGVGNLANMTTTNGAQVTFNFTGTQLTWMGYIPVEQPGNGSTASYSIDNGPPTSFFLVGHPPTDGTSTFNQVFFTTPQLAPGPHSMVVTYNGDSEVTPLTVDYIYLTTSPSDPSPAAVTQRDVKRAPIGAIVGGTVGGIALIVIILVIFFWRRRRRPTSSAPTTSTWLAGQPGSAVPPQGQDERIQPFSLTHHPSEISSSALLSSPSLAHSQSDSHTGQTMSDVTSPSIIYQSLQPRGYVSGAMAQIGDTKRGDTSLIPTLQTVNPVPYPGGSQLTRTQDGVEVIDDIPPRYIA